MKSKTSSLLSIIYFLMLLLFSLLFFLRCEFKSTVQTENDNNSFSDTIFIHDTLFFPQSKQQIQIFPDSVRVDSFYNDLNGNKMIDGITAFVNGEQTRSRWAVEGYPHYAVFSFDSLVSINLIRINLYKGDQGYMNHIKLYNFSDLIFAGDIGNSLWNTVLVKFYGSSIFLEIDKPNNPNHTKVNNWTDIGEVEFYTLK